MSQQYGDYELRNIVETNIKTFTLYDAMHNIGIKSIGQNRWWIGYSTDNRARMGDFGTSFDLNYYEDIRTLYLLHLQIDASQRGRGHGSQIYEIICNIAKELDCLIVEQTPSGWTPSGDTRANYLIRRGWTIVNDVAIKNLG
jgi:hypothetical protein